MFALQRIELLFQDTYFSLIFLACSEALLPVSNFFSKLVILIAQFVTNALGLLQTFLSLCNRLELRIPL